MNPEMASVGKQELLLFLSGATTSAPEQVTPETTSTGNKQYYYTFPDSKHQSEVTIVD